VTVHVFDPTRPAGWPRRPIRIPDDLRLRRSYLLAGGRFEGEYGTVRATIAQLRGRSTGCRLAPGRNIMASCACLPWFLSTALPLPRFGHVGPTEVQGGAPRDRCSSATAA
jgi:hypothetical protein